MILVRSNGASGQYTFLIVAPGTAAGQQGGDWESNTFKGQLEVWSTSSSDQFAAYED